MNANYFPTDFLNALLEKRRKGRIFRAARLIREQSTHSPDALRTGSPTSEVDELLRDEDAFLEAKQEQADEQEARRQARQQALQVL